MAADIKTARRPSAMHIATAAFLQDFQSIELRVEEEAISKKLMEEAIELATKMKAPQNIIDKLKQINENTPQSINSKGTKASSRKPNNIGDTVQASVSFLNGDYFVKIPIDIYREKWNIIEEFQKGKEQYIADYMEANNGIKPKRERSMLEVDVTYQEDGILIKKKAT